MSGRHKMPPAGRRKAAAESAESAQPVAAEPVSLEETGFEPDSVEPGSAEPAPEEAAVEESVGPADESVVADEADEPPAVDGTDEPADGADETEEADEVVEPAEGAEEAEPSRPRAQVSLPVVLAIIALVLATASGVLRWLTVSQNESDTARVESVQAAKDITTQMLSYETETVDQQLTAARDRMTGGFRGTYTAMINEVIPAAHAKRIAAVADVLEVGTTTAKPDRVELVLFVNQSVQVGDEMPKKHPSVARVTMVKDGDQWLMSEYAPVPL
ncbi:hypothetical protein [Mycolicibacterium peregrinum]|uniref:hypothetical protein n=1 Tax=Mycolicibacterium peregrinum TaxID=43304 RepID=UPI0009EF325B|nr:hypothetical protein [Mycolicibacterium peregrinum]